MDERELKQRTKHFSLRVIKLVGALPKTVEGRAIGNQLVRSGTSVGANYRAACRGRSKAEFISRLGVVEEEADQHEGTEQLPRGRQTVNPSSPTPPTGLAVGFGREDRPTAPPKAARIHPSA